MQVGTFILLSILNLGVSLSPFSSQRQFWTTQKKGANIFSADLNEETISAAKKYNIQFLRLAVDKMEANQRDFLIGNCDNYTEINQQDLNKLKKILNICRKYDMPILLTMLSLPGARWNQNNGNKNDYRIYLETKFQKQAIKFWNDLSFALQEYSDIIIGYNILNEPRYERLHKIETCSKIHQEKLFTIYEAIINQIHKNSSKTSIILDLSSDSSVDCFRHLKPIKANNIVYSVHIYEPPEYTMSHAKWIKKPVKSYPSRLYNKKYLEKYLKGIALWQKKYNIPSDQILIGEFGTNRKNKGADIYFQDLIGIFNQNNWHWAFYAFRENTWHMMNYELGSRNPPSEYWAQYDKCEKEKFYPESCQNLGSEFYKQNNIFETIIKDLFQNTSTH